LSSGVSTSSTSETGDDVRNDKFDVRNDKLDVRNDKLDVRNEEAS
jgi:hypothetical protein